MTDLEDTAFYNSCDQRNGEVLKKRTQGMTFGYGTPCYYSLIRELLTLDFSKPD